MNEFFGNARGILETACAGAAGSQDAPEVSILIDPAGGIRIVADSDWPLDSLKREMGARLAYRVSRRYGKVRVVGLSEAQSCVLESDIPGLAARRLLTGVRRRAMEAPSCREISRLSNPLSFGR